MTVKFYDPSGNFTFEKKVAEITPEYCQGVKNHFAYGGYCTVKGEKVSSHKALEDLCKPSSKPLNVIVVFTQDGEHIHSWEADTSGLEALRMLEAACCSGLVDKDKPLDFIVYNDEVDEGVEIVLLEGSIKPGLINLNFN